MTVKYICLECGEIFEEPDTYTECVGEYWGQPAYEDFADCPYCHGGFKEFTEDDEEIYQLGYDKAVSDLKDRRQSNLKQIEEYVDCSKMTGTEVMQMMKEIMYGKNVSELVRKYRNK